MAEIVPEAPTSVKLGLEKQFWGVFSPLKLTAIAPENGQNPERKQSYSNHPFSGAFAVSLGEGNLIHSMKN